LALGRIDMESLVQEYSYPRSMFITYGAAALVSALVAIGGELWFEGSPSAKILAISVPAIAALLLAWGAWHHRTYCLVLGASAVTWSGTSNSTLPFSTIRALRIDATRLGKVLTAIQASGRKIYFSGNIRDFDGFADELGRRCRIGISRSI
jgi:hypothetical protein